MRSTGACPHNSAGSQIHRRESRLWPVWPCPVASFELLEEVCSGTSIAFLCGLLQGTDTASGCCQDSIRGSSPLWPRAMPPVTSVVVFDRTWMQAFVHFCSSSILCFLHPSQYHPSEFLTYCMLDSHFGHLQVPFLQLWQPPCEHALATNLCVSRNSRTPHLFEAPGN